MQCFSVTVMGRAPTAGMPGAAQLLLEVRDQVPSIIPAAIPAAVEIWMLNEFLSRHTHPGGAAASGPGAPHRPVPKRPLGRFGIPTGRGAPGSRGRAKVSDDPDLLWEQAREISATKSRASASHKSDGRKKNRWMCVLLY